MAHTQYVNFVDVLSLALAWTWKGRRDHLFSQNRGAWHVAVCEIIERFGDKVPPLRDIFFTYRPPLAPYSDQVDQWLSMLSRSGLLDMYPMQNHPFRMTVAQRRNIVRRNRRRLAQLDPTIKEMAKVFKEHLKPA